MRPKQVIKLILIPANLLPYNFIVCVSAGRDGRCDKKAQVIPRRRKFFPIDCNESIGRNLTP